MPNKTVIAANAISVILNPGETAIDELSPGLKYMD